MDWWSAWRHIFSDGAHMLIQRHCTTYTLQNITYNRKEPSLSSAAATFLYIYTLELCFVCAHWIADVVCAVLLLLLLLSSSFCFCFNFLAWWYAIIHRASSKKNVCTQSFSPFDPKIYWWGRCNWQREGKKRKRKTKRVSLVSNAVQTSARGEWKKMPFVFIRHQWERIKSAIHLMILRGKMSPVCCSVFSIYDRVYLPQITFFLSIYILNGSLFLSLSLTKLSIAPQTQRKLY